MKHVVAALAAFALGLVSHACAAQDAAATSYAPRDECREVPGASAFLDALTAAVEARDTDALVAMAADHVTLDFGGGEGKDQLRARLDGKFDTYPDLWSELSIVLSLGCAAGADGVIILPWYFAQDFGDRDPFATMLVIRPGAKARAAPDRAAETVATLDWDVVEVSGDYRPGAEFNRVVLPDGSEGYVETAALRSLVDYRLLAEATDDGWKITAFVAGD